MHGVLELLASGKEDADRRTMIGLSIDNNRRIPRLTKHCELTPIYMCKPITLLLPIASRMASQMAERAEWKRFPPRAVA